jgi:hypothetical protein
MTFHSVRGGRFLPRRGSRQYDLLVRDREVLPPSHKKDPTDNFT